MNEYNKIDYDNIKRKINQINKCTNKINIMEVCGTHTVAISKYGLRNLFNENINLISGPGCPVCVTPDIYIDYIYYLSLKKDIIIASYGDMIRVPGSKPNISLENAKALGANIKMVYSSLDALKIAKQNEDKKVVFLGIGFETTVPSTAVAIIEAERQGISNFYVLSLHKVVKPVMINLLKDKELNIDGFICPGHVAAIIGVEGFKFLEQYKCASTVTGFKLEEVLNGIYTTVSNIQNKNYRVFNCYNTVVKYEGNTVAKKLINDVFTLKDDYWRGIGLIKNSGLKLKNKYDNYNIENIYPNNIKYRSNKKGCRCGDVLKGKIKPYEVCVKF